MSIDILYCTKCNKEYRVHGQRWCLVCKKIYARYYRKTPNGSLLAKNRDNRVKQTNMYIAKNKVYVAVRKGILPRVKTLKCVDCGCKAQCYDHRDYHKPLEVVPTCIKCNLKRGEGLNRVGKL